MTFPEKDLNPNSNQNELVPVYVHEYTLRISGSERILVKDGMICPCLNVQPLLTQPEIAGGTPNVLRTVACSTLCPKANVLKYSKRSEHIDHIDKSGKTEKEIEALTAKFEQALDKRTLIYQISCQGEVIDLPISGVEEQKQKSNVITMGK